ncbi:MAG TPA: NUDIX domain-containing protein, partial [Acidimicrobiales bacterium]|nr:NUDIX domain-containing protein [Acidimicrobiales bacterium]
MARGVTRRALTLDRSTLVQAAGGVLLRRSGRRRLEVAVIHRPVRKDWSLPKGKLEPDETFEGCAVREVLEETGYACVLGAFAGQTQYVDRRGRPKVVAYWFMDPAPGVRFDDTAPLMATDEVDEVR